MIFVSYALYSKTSHGFGNINICLEGIYSTEDKREVEEYIQQSCIEKLENSEDVQVAILNWRKYDAPV